MHAIRSVLVAITLVGCSNALSAPTAPNRAVQSEVRVVNATADPFVFFAIAADLAPLLDPIPEVSVTEPWAQPLAPADERVLREIPGRDGAPNGGVAVYLYGLTRDRTRARFTRVELVSGETIRSAGNRIIIQRLGS